MPDNFVQGILRDDDENAAHAQVDLIMMGERYRRMLEHGIDPAEMERSAIGFTDDVSCTQPALALLNTASL